MKKLLLALSIIAGTATTFLVMQQEPTQAKASLGYDANYMYISDYEIKSTTINGPILDIRFTGRFKRFKETPIFEDYIQKYIIYELNLTYNNYQFIELESLYEDNNNGFENYKYYYELFKDTKENDNGEEVETLTILTNTKERKITNYQDANYYVLRINTVYELREQEDIEIINDIVQQTFKNFKIANSKYALDKITAFGAIKDYNYKQGYNAGFYAGQKIADLASYNDGYTDGYKKGEEGGTLTGKREGYEIGYNRGYNEGIKDNDNDYSKGYKEGYEKAIKDAKVLPETIFTTIGSVAGFIGQLGKVEILGISLLDVLAMITIVGVIILITKVAL